MNIIGKSAHAADFGVHLWHTLVYWLENLFPNIRKVLFKRKLLRQHLRRQPPLRILFGCHLGWEPTLRKAFAETAHTVSFKKISECNPAEYDLVFPLTLPEVIALQQKLPDRRAYPLPLPNRKVMECCNDKQLFYEFMHASGFGAYIPFTGKPEGFPYYLKKKVSHGGRDSELITDAAAESAHLDKLFSDDYLAQAAVPGNKEFATHILFRSGAIVAAFTICHHHRTPLYIRGHQKASSAYSDLCKNQHLRLFGDILCCLGFEGICCFDYKVVNGSPVIFEINPRIGGSAMEYVLFFINALEISKHQVLRLQPSAVKAAVASARTYQ